MSQLNLAEQRRDRYELQRDQWQNEITRLRTMIGSTAIAPDILARSIAEAEASYNRAQEKFEEADLEVAFITETEQLLNDIENATGGSISSDVVIDWFNRSRSPSIRNTVKDRLVARIAGKAQEGFQAATNKEDFVQALKDAHLPEDIWGSLEKKLSAEQRQALITDINGLDASKTNTDLRNLATSIQGDTDLTQRLSNRIFDIYTSEAPTNKDNYVNTRLPGLPDSIANTTREYHEQVFRKQEVLNKIRVWAPSAMPAVTDITDVYNTIRNIRDNQPILDELRDTLDRLYEQDRATGNTGQGVIDAAQNLPDTLIGELRKKHEANVKEVDRNKIRTRIQGLGPAVGAVHCTPTILGGGSTGVSIQEIYDDIVASPHKDLVGELTGRLEQLYRSFSDADKDTMVSNLKAGNINPAVADPIFKIHSEVLIGRLKREIEAFNFSVTATPAELQQIRDFAGRAKGDEGVVKQLKEKVGHYYHTVLTTPEQRHAFVNDARRERVPDNLIGEYLWKETDKRVEDAEALIDKLEPIIRDHVAAGRGTGTDYFDTTLLPQYLVPASRSGIPKETVEELRIRFEQACNEEDQHQADAPVLRGITKGFTDAIVEQLLPGKIAQDPFADDRAPILTLTTSGLVEKNRINYGVLRRNVVAAVNGNFTTVDVFRRDMLVEEIFRNILEDMREHMPDIIEINKLEREADRLRAKSRELRVDMWKLWGKDALAIAGIAATLVGVGAAASGVGVWGTAGALANIWNFLTQQRAGHIGVAVGVPALCIGIFERWKQHSGAREKMQIAAADLEGKELEITSRVSSVAEKRGLQMQRRRVHYDGLSRMLLRPSAALGRENFETRHEFMRRQLMKADAPQLAQFAVG